MCKDVVTKKIAKAAVNRWHYAHGILNGKGSGSATGKGVDNYMYKDGLSLFKKYAKERKETIGLCEEWHENYAYKLSNQLDCDADRNEKLDSWSHDELDSMR